MEVHRLPLPPLGANCYLLQNGTQGLVLDPGGAPETVVSACRDLGMDPAAILLTHGHYDHVGAVAALLHTWPEIPLYLHPADLQEKDGELFPLGVQLDAETKASRVRSLREGEVLDLAGLQVAVLHTPGHSKGSCCFLVEDCLFTGDTLFRFSMGRTDFPGGAPSEMSASLARLAALAGDYRVYPGHDAPTTLDQERFHNPYLQNLRP